MEKIVDELPQLPSHIKTVHRFAEKSELLATEAFTIFKQKREIHRIIALIIIHQATEHFFSFIWVEILIGAIGIINSRF